MGRLFDDINKLVNTDIEEDTTEEVKMTNFFTNFGSGLAPNENIDKPDVSDNNQNYVSLHSQVELLPRQKNGGYKKETEEIEFLDDL